MTQDDRYPHSDAVDRLAELADLLATGLIRLRLRQASKSSELFCVRGESSLDGSLHQSMHGDPETEGFPT